MGLNSVILIGRLTNNPELKQTTSGKSVVTYTLAVDRIQKGEADFISCVAWEKTAEFMSKYLKKGSKIAIQGRIQTRTYDRQDGSKAYVTEVVSDKVEFCEAKGETKPSEEPNFENIDVNADNLPF